MMSDKDDQQPQNNAKNTLNVRSLGEVEYIPVWDAMKSFTDHRDDTTADEIWLLQHPPVFTQGQAGKPEHILFSGDIPVVQVDRGGQVTYHGPGQLIAYIMVDIKRRNMGARALVSLIEQAIVDTLALYGINSAARKDAPGVYVDEAKIASLGLRIRKGRSFHGLSLNIDMDLSPFARINPCGYQGMKIVQLSELIQQDAVDGVLSPSHQKQHLIEHVAKTLLAKLAMAFEYEDVNYLHELPEL